MIPKRTGARSTQWRVAEPADTRMSTMRLRNSYRRLKRDSRALLGRDLRTYPQLKCATLGLGGDGAEWTVCPDAISPNSVIYSAGVGEEISFDLEMIRRFGAIVHAFDPTPRAIEWIKARSLPEKFVFHPYGVAAKDGVRKFNPPTNPHHVSHSILNRDSPLPAIELPVYRLSAILLMLGHTKIDLLKMDIEGAEYEVIDDLVDSGISVRQLLVEFHHRWPQVGLDKTRQALKKLDEAGFKLFSVSPTGEEYGFLSV
jgi:FkbM family methyltransferase